MFYVITRRGNWLINYFALHFYRIVLKNSIDA